MEGLAFVFAVVLLVGISLQARAQGVAAPFACRIDALCETDKDCIWMPQVAPTTFYAFDNRPAETEDGAPLLRFEGLRQRPSVTALFERLETAKNWAYVRALDTDVSAVMTPSGHVAGRRGFQVYDVQCFASGKCRLSAASVLISCEAV